METTGIEAPRSPLFFGIDLGTTNSAIAVFEESGPRILKIGGAETMPSVVSMDKEGNFSVGIAAAHRIMATPDRVAASVKRRMGIAEAVVPLGDQMFSPTDLSAKILGSLADSVYLSEGEALGGRPYHVVICVPANFMQDQKDETRRAAEMAGLHCVALLEEPVAAAIAYAMRGQTNQTILVYDFGGGTLDVSILKAVSDPTRGVLLKVMGTAGDPLLGGDDFDLKIMEAALDKLAETGPRLSLDGTHAEISKATVRAALQKIKIGAANAKHELTTMEEASLLIPDVIVDHEGNSHTLDYTLTRAEFETMARPLVDRSIPCVEAALAEAGLDKDQLDKVVLAGGTTRIPLVREVLTSAMGKEPWADQSVDTAIARGAAIECDALFKPSGGGVHIENIVTHFLGLELSSGAFDVLLAKGDEIPAEGLATTRTYFNEADDIESVSIRLYQADMAIPQVRLAQDELDELMATQGRAPTIQCIGTFPVPIQKGPARTIPVEVTMTLDSTNVLKVVAKSSVGGEEFVVDRKGVR